jgi:predicted nucleic acid-binding protein
MSDIPIDRLVFVDTNILLYSIGSHPLHGLWCDQLFDAISIGKSKGYISVIVLNELLHKLIIGEIAQKYNLKPEHVISHLKRNRAMLHDL